MASVPDILGLTHIAVSTVVQLIIALRRQVRAYRSLPGLLESAEQKTRRIESSIDSLLELAEVTELKSEFFLHACDEAQVVEQELVAIHNEYNHSSSRTALLASSDLIQRLSGINEKLDNLDRTFNVVGMTGDLVLKKIDKKCEDINVRLNELTIVFNRVLLQKDPFSGAQAVHDAIQGDPGLIFDGLSRHQHSVRELYAMEHYAQVYYALGRSYYTGEHEKGKNCYMAARYLQASFNSGAKSSSYYLGKLYFDGNGVNRSFNTAFKYYSIGGELGHAESLREMGWCYEHGYGTVDDLGKALEYYSRASNRGSAMGTYSLGYHCLHGNGIRRNWPRAQRLLKKASRMGAVRANFDLAHLYENGIGGVERNPKYAAKLLADAYNAGDEQSTSYLAWCYCRGVGVEQDFSKAAALFRELKEKSLFGRKYQGYLGLLLIQGLGIEKNERAGLKIVQQGTDRNFACGWTCYGDIYRHGLGMKKDTKKALYYYSKAASCYMGSRGVRDAHTALAEMYDNGEGVPRCEERATSHYIEAAMRMNTTAQWKAATYLESGTGVAVHQYRAFYFFDLAARGGYVPAQRRAGELYMKGIGVQRDRTRAMQFLEQAAEGGDAVAKKILRRKQIARYFGFDRRHTE